MAQMLSSLACLFEKATHSEGRHLAEIDELTDLHRAALSVLISEVEASLPPLQVRQGVENIYVNGRLRNVMVGCALVVAFCMRLRFAWQQFDRRATPQRR